MLKKQVPFRTDSRTMGRTWVLSYGVARRTSEIGIRKALGAQHNAVMVMILRETGVLLLAGLVVGTFLAATGIQLIATRLYGLAPTDPVASGVAVVMLGGVALLAAWVPANGNCAVGKRL